MPQPAFFNGRPETFVVRAEAGKIHWPPSIRWKKETSTAKARPNPRPRFPAWSKKDAAAYRQDVEALAGERDVIFPVTGKRLRLSRKNSAQSRNQLEALTNYLAERYAALGIKVRRQRFVWRGIPQENLMAVISGRLSGRKNRPVILVDHIDTAFSQDVFDKSGRRVSAPGADDNATATAALLRAAEVLRNARPEHDIVLLHLTGEEFPADDLGVRHFLSQMLKEDREIGGVVLMDMIGYKSRQDRVFQVNAAADGRSLRMARAAIALARRLATAYQAILRTRFDPESYLYNTDGLDFTEAGYPVVLFNEDINGLHHLNRRHYHDSTDTSRYVNFKLAATIARLAIETAAFWAHAR